MRTLIFLLSLIAMSAQAQDPAPVADGPKYSYVGVGYTFETDADDIDTLSFSNSAFSVGGGYEISDLFHVSAGYARVMTDISGTLDGFLFDGDAETNVYQIMGGMHYGITPTVDLVTELGWQFIDGAGFDDNSLVIAGGAEAMLGSKIQAGARVGYLENTDSVFFVVDADLFATDAITVGAGVTFTEDSDPSIAIQAKYFF